MSLFSKSSGHKSRIALFSMKEESVFEQFIREKVEKIRLHPSEHVWNTVLNTLNETYTPRFHTLLIFFWGIIFLNISIPLGEMLPGKYAPRTDFTSSAVQANNRMPQLSADKGYPATNHTIIQEVKENDQELSFICEPALIHKQFIAKRDSYISQAAFFFPDHNPANNLTPHQINVRNPISTAVHSANQYENDKKFLDKLKQKLKLSDTKGGIQFYFTPSVSYRVLYIDNEPYFKNNGKDPESSVSHYPSTGLEAGVAILRKVSKRWSFRAGIQLNFSRYNINATKTAPELIYVGLSQNTGFERNTNIRNGGGFLPKQLMNENLQICLPVGMEYMAIGNDKLSFNIAGTLQPGMSLHAGGYMVTTNYKNYIPADNIFRRYNIQTGIECFVKTNLGLIDLQAGPQLRYQLLSNTMGSYPIKEHLIDYGFKIGIIKKIQ